MTKSPDVRFSVPSLDPRVLWPEPGTRTLSVFVEGDVPDTIDLDLTLPNEARILMILASDALAAREPERAIELLEAARRLGASRDPSWHGCLGHAYTQMRKHRKAAAAFAKSLEIQPSSFTMRMALAHSRILSREWKKAARVLRDLEKGHAGDRRASARIQRAIGFLRTQQGKLDAAERALARAIELDPKDPVAYDALGRIFAERARTSGGFASEHADRVIELYGMLAAERPDLGEPRAEVGAMLERRGDTAGAIAEYRRALEVGINNNAVLERVGLSLLNLGEIEDAARALEESHRRRPDDLLALSVLGAISGMRGDHERAAELLRRAVERGADLSINRSNLGASLFNLGRTAEALEEVLAATADPENELAWSNLEEILGAIAQGGTAGEVPPPLLAKALEVLPRDPKTDPLRAALEGASTGSPAPARPDPAESPAGAGEPGDTPAVALEDYEVRDGARTRAFLVEHRFLEPLLEEARVALRDVFGDEARPAVELFVDEEEPEHRELFVLVPTRLEPPAARELLRRFKSSWWAEARERARRKLAFDLEYLP